MNGTKPRVRKETPVSTVNGFFTRVPRPFNGKTTVSSTNGAGTGEPHAGGGRSTPLSQHIQKLSQNGSRT